MLAILLLFGIPLLFSGLAALLLDWRWPNMAVRRQRAIASLVSILAIFGAAAWMIMVARADTSNSPDSAGFVVAGAMLLVIFGVPVSILASRLIIRYLRGI